MGRLTGLHIRCSLFFLCKEILKKVKNLKLGLNFNIILIVIDVPVWVRKVQCSHIPNTNGCRSSTLHLHVQWPPEVVYTEQPRNVEELQNKAQS